MIKIVACNNKLSSRCFQTFMASILNSIHNQNNELRSSSDFCYSQKLHFYTTSGIDSGDFIA